MSKDEQKGKKNLTEPNKTAVCPLCNTVFTKRRSSQKICRTNHEVKCFGCGKVFILGRYYSGRNNYSCGEKSCRQKLSENTNKEKYGVTNPAKAKLVRERISEKRNSRTPEQKESELIKQRATMVKRYGVKHPLQSKEIRARAKKTSLERYGVDNPAKADEVKKKTKESNLRKYGVSSTSKLPSVKEKSKRTKLERYGTDDLVHKSEYHKRKYEETNLKRYGVKNPSQSNEIKEKIKKRNLERHGVEWTTQSKDTQIKMRKSLVERYDVDNPGKSKEIMVRALEKSSETRLKKSFINEKDKNSIFNKLEKDYLTKKNISRETIEKNFKNTPLNKVNLASFFGITPQSMNRVLKKNNIEEFFRSPLSNKELSLLNYLKENHPEVNFRYNDRKVLNGQELDFYFPEQKLAVEISPTSTHNSLKGAFNQEPKERTYHKDKFIKCSELGVELITVFDWHPWGNILELISSKLNDHDKRIPARKTIYEEHKHINKDLFSLLSTWHTLSLPSNFKRKNDVSTLSYNGEIVGVALWTDTKDSKTKELKRMVFKPGSSIVGGPSKLIKNYLKAHETIDNITTFSDCDLGQGLTYGKIGFTLIEESKPTLTYWSDKYKKKIKYTSLVMQGADRLLRTIPGYNHVGRDSSLTNTDIVLAYGFLPVYDCGYRKWILRKTINAN